MGHSATAGRTLLRVEREAEACRLRCKGLHYAEIAARMGTSTSVAWTYVNRRLRALNALADKEAMHLRRIESERLLMAMKALADRVEDSDVEAIREWRLLSESMRKLWGLDAPQKQEFSGGLALGIVEELVDVTGASEVAQSAG